MQRLGDAATSLNLEGNNYSNLLQYDPAYQAMSSPTSLLDPFTVTSLPPVTSNLNQLLSTAPNTISVLSPGLTAGNAVTNAAGAAGAFGSLGTAIANLFNGSGSAQSTSTVARTGTVTIAGHSVSTSTLEIGAAVVGVLLLVSLFAGSKRRR